MIDERLRAVAERWPGRAALVCGERRISHGELADRIARARGALHALGLGPDGLLLLALPNCPEFVVGYFATAGLGARVLALDPGLTQAEYHQVLAEGRPDVVITTAALAPRWAELAPGAVLVVVGDGPAEGGRAFDELMRADALPARPADPDRAWVLTYSSGSTGEPKRICRSQDNQLAEADHIIASAAVTPDDVLLCPVPLYHALGQFCCMIVAVLAGATLVLPEPSGAVGAVETGGPDPAGLLALVARHRVTVLPSVPYLLGALADWPEDRPADLSSVRLCLSGSNFLAPAVRERFLARFGVPVRQTYGSSEAGSVSWDCDPDGFVPESVGRPLRGVRVEVLDEQGRVLPTGSTGEIAVTSRSVMLGELAPGGTLLRPGPERYLTGDLGRLDEDGRLHLTGRKRILVDTGGHKVNPVEVEEVLEAHPAVRAAAVVGVPLAGGGDLLVAAVVPGDDGPVPAEELRAHCRARLAGHKVPARFETVAALPRTELGKLRRGRLAAELAALVDTGAARPAVGIWDEPDPRRRAHLLTEHLRRRTADLLAVRPERLDPAAPLHAQGLDSLAALRLKMAVQDDLRRTVGLPELLGGASLDTLARRLADDTEGPTEVFVARGPVVGEFPLSHNQSAIWHADQLVPEAAAYNQSFAARITSECDPDALRRAFQTLVDRHPALRTTFALRDGRPVQRVAEHADVDFAVVTVPADWPDRTERLSATAFRPFELDRETPLRVRLHLGAADGPVLLVTVHHIATDFWSTVALLRDLAAAHAADGELYRPAPRHGYTDYVRWQAETLAGPAAERDWAYWRELLADPPPALELPADRPRPVVQSQRGALHVHELDQPRVKALQDFARRHGSTVYTVLLAAFQGYLHAWTGERDIAVATITTNRQRSEFADVLGYFVNPVVCRTEVDPRRPFTDLLAATGRGLLAGLEHQQLPFATVVERLAAEQPGRRRDRSRTPLVEIGFGQNKAQDGGMLAVSRFLSGAGQELRLGSLALESLPLRRRGVVYDFSGAVHESADTVAIAWEYNTDLYEAATVERFAAQFEEWVGRLLERPERPLAEVDAEGGGPLSDVAAPAGPAPALPQAIGGLARAHPGRAALVAGTDTLTYGQVSDRAGALAARIAARGLAPGVRVLLWFPERSADLLTAGLAVLRSGAVAEPLDTAAEVRRACADADLLITTAAARAELGELPLPVLCPEEAGEAGRAEPVPVGPADPALVLRTSGVTGEPSAVLQPHGALAAWAHWLAGQSGPAARVLVHGALSADQVLARSLAALGAGATVVLDTTVGLSRLLCGSQVFDFVTVTASELSALLPALAATGREPAVRTLLVTGEPLTPAVAQRWLATAPDSRLLHGYGGAQTAPVVCVREVGADDLPATDPFRPLPVGRALDGMAVRVLDDVGRPAPAGVSGQLWVTRFPGDEPVRTGDLARRLPDGGIVVLGRAADLTRRNGYLVAPGRVEAALLGLPGVLGAAVVPEDADLVARVAVGQSTPRLREALRELLPEYLLPSAVLLTDRLPAARNGKTARTGLSAAVRPRAEEPDRPADATDPAEAVLAAIWAEVLGVAEVGPEDDYFDLDGDSITSMSIVSRAAEAGLRLTPRQIFTHPTVRELAAVAERTAAPGPGTPTSSDGPARVPLAPVQQWFLDLPLVRPQHWNQTLLLRAAPGLDADLLRRALLAVAAHHPALRFRYHRDEDGWHQTARPDAEPVRVLDATGTGPDAESAAASAQAELDLTDGPLFAAVLLPEGDEPGLRLLLTAHHLVVDFVSWQILLDDLGRACEQLLAGGEVRLPPLTTPFAEWTARLHAHADTPAVRAELDRWTRPAARPDARPDAGTEGQAALAEAALPADATAALLAATGGRGRDRAQDVLLAAVAQAVAEWTGEREVVLDVETHGRAELFPDVDLSRTVGWFTAVHPVTVAPDRSAGEAGPAATYRTVRALLDALPAEGLGHGLLRYAASDPAVRDRLAARPPATVNVNYLGRAGRLVGGGAPAEGRALTPLPLAGTGDRGPGNPRPYPLEVSALLIDDRLLVRVRHNAAAHPPADVRRLLDRVLTGLTAIVSTLATVPAADRAHPLAGGQ
ncbi:condensation domain-containing protein [Streptomyces sp. SP17BM10]|uniref:condensation domain-containing protein n=1 Tax=Streptomyces sp. SP17BM10 TaxID=3002530 RepID=UPI002E76B209|nr:condensation domain-containing protein [Streptomyces sp. SP17BM10]MEE1784458.1 condensation domain-containing protein [Streptomyces sp. SP17BM10]